MSGSRLSAWWLNMSNLVADPGASGTVNLANKGYACLKIVTAAAESRTIPAPERMGQRLLVSLKTDGGNATCTITNGQGISSLVLDDAGDWFELLSVDNGGTIKWGLVASEGLLSGGGEDFDAILVNDDGLLRLGTDGDQVLVNRSTALNANTALTSVLIGTPAVTAIPANSQIVSNVTADGDQVFATVPAAGTNSIEWLRNDASAGITIVNDAAADLDFRVEGDTNANMLVVHAGTDSAAFGSAVVAGAGLSISNLTGRSTVTSVGTQVHHPSATFNDTAGAATIAIQADTFVGIMTHTATNARTYSDCASVYIAGAPVASTNVTQTRSYALLVDTGIVRIDEALELGLAGTVIGTLKLSGNTSGTITIVPAAAAGTWTWTLPADDGDSGEQLQTNGSGVTTWEAAGSLREVKNVIAEVSDRCFDVLDRLCNAGVYEFTYKEGARPTTRDFDTHYTGIMADDLPEFMHHGGRIFSPVSAVGHLLLAIKALNAKVDRLASQG